MTAALHIIICGVTGKMGQAIVKAALQENPQVKIVGSTSRKKSPVISGEFSVSDSLEEAISKANLANTIQPVIIDFTNASSTISHAQIAAKHQLPLVVGTTALEEAQHTALKKAAEEIPVLVASNMSIGAHVLHILSRLTAQLMPKADVEICEIHHSSKKDCPSGTAYSLAKTVANARNQDFKSSLVLHRDMQGQRQSGEIGVVGLRGGTAKGEHSVYFFSENELIELKHHVDDPVVFAQGALKAAWYLALQKPGLHNMTDVLGMKTP